MYTMFRILYLSFSLDSFPSVQSIILVFLLQKRIQLIEVNR